MIGLIRINRFDKHKDGIRVEFLCGRWALEDARRKNEYVWQAGRLLSMKPEGVPQGLRKLQEEVTELNERLKAQSAKLYEFLAPQLLAQVLSMRAALNMSRRHRRIAAPPMPDCC